MIHRGTNLLLPDHFKPFATSGSVGLLDSIRDLSTKFLPCGLG